MQFQELFRDVQMEGIFHDGKTFADVQYNESADAILADYRIRKDNPDFDLKAFVQRHFSLPAERATVGPAGRD